jgi:pyruvate,water dikinase
MTTHPQLVRTFSTLSRADTAIVGGKNASLGEMIRALGGKGIPVPDGFATTADAYRSFIDHNDLAGRIRAELEGLSPDGANVGPIGSAIRAMILDGEIPDALAEAITTAYRDLCEAGADTEPTSVAVRSSATAEDLPEASFAGQLETYLNVQGEEALLEACRKCLASLFTDRAIIYRENHGFEHMDVALSVGVQEMVRADRGGAGVMFSIDTETGFPHTVLITAAWGLGETVVQGIVEPDEYHVFKPLLGDEARAPIVEKTLGAKSRKMVRAGGAGRTSKLVRTPRRERHSFVLSDDEVLQLARWACVIEEHYGQPMDIEWARDGITDEIHIVQARPETVQHRREGTTLQSYRIRAKGERLVTGVAIGDAVSTGRVCRIDSPADIDRFEPGSVLVTGTTDPDWVPIMKRAAAIVTDHGGRTSHAAIVSRELGLTAIVGAGDATRVLDGGTEVTVSCAEGDEGYVYAGTAEVDVEEVAVGDIPETRTRIMVNHANPGAAFRSWRLPTDGVGLARMEFIIGNLIRIHPMALVRFDDVPDRRTRRQIDELARGFGDRVEYFVGTLARGIARIAAAHHPHPVLVRMSDFKTNEYARLIGGEAFEPDEENPMLGWRGASRYYSDAYRDGFALECRAVVEARERIGMDNISIMIPFCRTLDEADRVLEVLADNGLVRGEEGLEIHVMAEIPSNVFLANGFAERFDGFSIGSNDLTQLILGVDRDSDVLSSLFDERNEAVMIAIRSLIEAAASTGSHTGICGQAPSDHPEFARFLVECGIDSISVTPDSFLAVKRVVADAEMELAGRSDA